MKINTNNLLKLVGLIVLCQIVGGVGALFTVPSIENWYSHLQKPFFNPPNWIFGPTWILLYFLMAIACYLVVVKKADTKKAIILFCAQLILNGLWSFLFFGLKSPVLGLIDIIVLLIFIILTWKSFKALSKMAGLLMLPYLFWVSFATLLNVSIWWLNR